MPQPLAKDSTTCTIVWKPHSSTWIWGFRLAKPKAAPNSSAAPYLQQRFLHPCLTGHQEPTVWLNAIVPWDVGRWFRSAPCWPPAARRNIRCCDKFRSRTTEICSNPDILVSNKFMTVRKDHTISGSSKTFLKQSTTTLDVHASEYHFQGGSRLC